MSQVTLDVTGRAQLDQVLVGLLPATALPGEDGDVYLDEEGTPIARRAAGKLEALQPLPWRAPDSVASSAPVVVAIGGKPIRSADAMTKALTGSKPGDSLVMDVVDQSGPRRLTVKVAKRP